MAVALCDVPCFYVRLTKIKLWNSETIIYLQNLKETNLGSEAASTVSTTTSATGKPPGAFRQWKRQNRGGMHLRLHGQAAHPQSERQRDSEQLPALMYRGYLQIAAIDAVSGAFRWFLFRDPTQHYAPATYPQRRRPAHPVEQRIQRGRTGACLLQLPTFQSAWRRVKHLLLMKSP